MVDISNNNYLFTLHALQSDKVISHHTWTDKDTAASVQSITSLVMITAQQGPLLLTWFNFNPSMDK